MRANAITPNPLKRGRPKKTNEGKTPLSDDQRATYEPPRQTTQGQNAIAILASLAPPRLPKTFAIESKDLVLTAGSALLHHGKKNPIHPCSPQAMV
jgi:hypothetical protein